jgi:prostatic aicd phosphatase
MYVGTALIALLEIKAFYQIFDYMNVNDIHNATFAEALPPTFLAQARALANWHEYNVFTDTSVSGIGNSESCRTDSDPTRWTHACDLVAGQAIVPSILDAFDNIVNASNPTKMMISAIAYKPFLSLFNMTGVAAANPQLAGIGESHPIPSCVLAEPMCMYASGLCLCRGLRSPPVERWR